MLRQVQVSIIIPFYNDEKYIEECIKSAIQQTEKNIEIICINDGSQDGSEAIIRKYAKEDRRIHIIRQENQGLSVARNTGIKQARGEYLCFLDADDRLYADAVYEIYQQATQNQVNLVTFDGTCFFQQPELYDEKAEQYFVRKQSYGCKEGIQLFTDMRARGDYCDSACLLFINREWLVKNKILFYPQIYHEDCLFTLQCMMRCKRVLHINRAFYNRRVRENSITTSTKTAKHLYGKMICHIHFTEFLHKENLTIEQATALANFSRTMIREMGEILDSLSEEEYRKLLDMPFTPVMRLSLEQAGIAWNETVPRVLQQEKNVYREGQKEMVNVENIVQMLQEEIAQKKQEIKITVKKDSMLLEKLEDKEKVIIVGSGNFGLQCYELIRQSGNDKVICFADNGYEKYTHGLIGKKVISLESAVEKYKDAHFVVTPKYHFMEIIRQLHEIGLPLEQIDCWIGF